MFVKNCWNEMHTYIHIHNWPLQPFSQDFGLSSHTSFVVGVNFIHKWRDLQFKVDSERQILFFEKLFITILFNLRVFARNLLRGNHWKRNFLYFGLMPGLTSNKSTHYPLDPKIIDLLIVYFAPIDVLTSWLSKPIAYLK